MMGERVRRRGAVLIVVLGVLIVLSLLATTFATLQMSERKISRNYIDLTRAKLVAMAGVEYAVARLRTSVERADFEDPSMTYWGSNTSEVGSPDAACPLERANNPSYAWEDETLQNPLPNDPAGSKPLQISIDGTNQGLSGMLTTGSYAPNGDVYRLRVTDANSLIHINDGVENGKTGYVSQNLIVILDNLSRVLGIPPAGDRIVNRRPAGGYRMKRELEALFPPSEFRKIAPFLTTQAWVDPNVVNPVPFSAQALRDGKYPVKYNERVNIFRYGRSFTASGQRLTQPILFAPECVRNPRTSFDHAIVALDEVTATWIERCSRAPVNINLTPREILISLIGGLQGVFIVERRKSNPGPYNMYSFTNHPRYEYMPGSPKGNEYGFLYSTEAFDARPSGLAEKIADEIIACRARQKSLHIRNRDYAVLWYGGPFRSWRQFNAFCDSLADDGLLVDTRPNLFTEYQLNHRDTRPTGNENSGTAGLWLQQRHAARAMADVLKANFNPNCTLNELNPDSNLHLLVDKTDLIHNSTEFCFGPMGYFEIESEGVVLETTGGQDLLKNREGWVVARKRITTMVRAFDVTRQTTQGDFAMGRFQPVVAASADTNNASTIEAGPEVDNGPAPKECRWGGWLQLPTLQATHSVSAQKPGADPPVSTPEGTAELSSAAHGHFSLDHRLHHHASGGMDPVRSHPDFKNNPDYTEGQQAGPYGPTVGAVGRHRAGRVWNLRGDPPIIEPAYLDVSAPTDLRVDGAYVERDSGLLYPVDATVLANRGTVAMWIKPSFYPEMTGRPRTWFCVDSYKVRRQGVINGFWFFASQYDQFEGGLPDTPGWFYRISPSGYWRPMSLSAGYSLKGGMGGGVGALTPSLNHRSHDHGKNPSYPYDTDHIRAHGWAHIVYHWDFAGTPTPGGDETGEPGTSEKQAIILVNGQRFLDPIGADVRVHPENDCDAADFLVSNLMRIGESSRTAGAGRESRNWAADATIDEFYLWKGNHLKNARDLYALGRYYVPAPGAESTFTSAPVKFSTPTSGPRGLASGIGAASSTLPSGQVPTLRVLSIAWTLLPERSLGVATGGVSGLLPAGTPVIRDASIQTDVEVQVECRLVLGGQPVPVLLKNEVGSGIEDLTIREDDELRYELKIRIPDAALDTILLTTPVIDDVTIYFTRGTEFLSYEWLEVTL